MNRFFTILVLLLMYGSQPGTCRASPSKSADHWRVTVYKLEKGSPGPTDLDRPGDSGGTSGFLKRRLFESGEFFYLEMDCSPYDQDCYLEVGSTPLDIQSIVYIDQNGKQLEKREFTRDFPGFIGPLVRSPDGTSRAILHVTTPLPFRTKLSLLDQQGVEQTRKSEERMNIVLATVTLVLTVHFLFFLIFTHDVLYLYFAGFFLTFLAYFGFYSGLLGRMDLPVSRYTVLFASATLGLYLLNQISIRLFHMGQRSRLIDRFLRGYSLVFLLLFIFYFVFPDPMYSLFFIAGFINALLLILVSFHIILFGSRPEKWLAFVLLISQFINLHLGTYISGLLDLLTGYSSDSILLYNLTQGAEFMGFLALWSALFAGSIFARYSAVYNRLQLVEDEGKRIDPVAVKIHTDAARGEELPFQFTESQLASFRHQLELLLEEKKVYRDPELNVKKLAHQLGIADWKFSILLNQYMKVSFFDYIAEYRIREVEELLRTRPDLTILRIAFDAGFDSKTTFNRNFLKRKGITPSEYRNKFRDVE